MEQARPLGVAQVPARRGQVVKPSAIGATCILGAERGKPRVAGECPGVPRDAALQIPEAVAAYLNRIKYLDGMPILYPLTRPNDPSGPRRIVMLPHVGFGRPVTDRKHITAATIASRFAAGESVEELAEDYELESADIEEALRVPTDDVKLAA